MYRSSLICVNLPRCALTRVGWVAGALEDLLQAQEVLLALAAWVSEVLPAAQLRKLNQDHLNEEQ